MSSPTETAARSYVAAWQEPDPAARARLIEACFAADGRIVAPGSVIRGRAGLARAIADREGRVVFEGFDAAEVDTDGRITILLAFSGAPPAPLPGS